MPQPPHALNAPVASQVCIPNEPFVHAHWIASPGAHAAAAPDSPDSPGLALQPTAATATVPPNKMAHTCGRPSLFRIIDTVRIVGNSVTSSQVAVNALNGPAC
jgi:hypothetical protein